MEKMTPKLLVQGAIELYSLPDIYMQLQQMIDDERFFAKDYVVVIAKDPALSARLLKIVNSSLYGFPARIETISRAITIIGIEELQNLVLATTVVDTFTAVPCELVDMTDFWLKSVTCGVIARLLAKKVSMLHYERLIVMGLLHNLGSMVLYSKMPDQSMQVLKSAMDTRQLIPELEQQIIGFTYADVSGELLKSWALPQSLVEAVACQLTPEKASEYQLDAQLLCLAVRLCDITTMENTPEEVVSRIAAAGTMIAGFGEHELNQVLALAENDFAEIFGMIMPKNHLH
jgi:HD-like signal output (HDOD) protein